MKKTWIYKYLIPCILLLVMTACGAANSSPGTSPVTRNADWRPVEQDFDGVTMVLVPAGCFMMGSEEANSSDELPVHEQCFDESFWIDKYEVTNAQFASFGGQATGSNPWTEDNHPRTNVTWFEARDFCALRGVSLPTEVQWEYAARGVQSWGFPWGNSFVASNLVYESQPNNTSGRPATVGSRSRGASWVGALDMSGNVWEWTSSLFEPYPYDADDGREADTGDRTDVRRVLRGGSWSHFIIFYLRSDVRGNASPSFRNDSGGFRCVRAVATES